MTALPIQLPQGSQPVVTVGDTVTKGQVLATFSQQLQTSSSQSETSPAEVRISLPEQFNEEATKVGKYVVVAPGDVIAVGDTIALKKGGLTLKKVRLVSKIQGTVLRFERGSGDLIIRIPKAVEHIESIQQKPQDIVAPLDGKVTVCNNEKIVLESETDSLTGKKGSGPEVMGELDSHLFTNGSKENPVSASQVKSESIGKILLVWIIGREALVKADAIGVKGIVTTALSEEDLSYVKAKHKGLPVVEVDESVAKKVQSTKATQIVLHGSNATIIEAH